MANHSLTEFLSFVNQQMVSIEDLNEHLSKASTLIEVAMYHDFSKQSQENVYHYLWVLSDVLKSAHVSTASLFNMAFEASKNKGN